MIVLLGIVTACPTLAQQNNDEQELIRLDREWGTASMKGDAAFLNRIYADDFTTSTPQGMRNKQQIVDETVKDAANLKNPAYTSDNYAVRFIGSDTAVMTHTGVASGEDRGKAFNDPHRSMHIWVRRNGRWQVFATTAAPLDAQQVLMQLERDWNDAVKRRDAAWLERYLADDFMWTSPEGTVNDKAKEITGIKDLTFETLDSTDMQVRVYGDTAVMTGSTTVKGKYKDQDISGAYRFTDTFVRRDGQWQIAASQVTRIAQQTATK
jgi:ketosteroid isomerase-like protein